MLAAYCDGDAEIESWFAKPWRGAEAWQRHTASTSPVDRAALARVLNASLNERGAPPASRAAAKRLGTAGVWAVVAGQQPSVGGGPLLSLCKTAHAIALARRLEAEGIPAVPVFWCASEDHDHGEADHADLIHRDGRIQRVRTHLPQAGASSRFQPVAGWWQELRAALSTLSPQLGHAWWDHHAPEPEETMGRWLCRVFDSVFAEAGLVSVEAYQLRPLWRERWADLATTWPHAALQQRRAAISAAGYTPGLELDTPPVFADRPEGRTSVAPEEIAQLAANTPDLLSPGAGLRPVLQQAALPCLLACLGPGELAYHAEIGPVYQALGLRPPLLIPRSGATLIPAWLQRGAAAWGLEPSELLAQQCPVVATPPPPELAALDAAIADLAATNTGSADQQRRLHSGAQRLQRERQRLAASLERGRRHAAARPPIGALHAYLRPRGGPQERCMSLAQALWEFGPGLGMQLVERFAGDDAGKHHLVAL
ncbi:MAG: bacillithiol biosynthesis BshC [Planctomycetota bacterium]|jgi:hypothetical protein|nr:bacillithiol biosynthesis BshC [Planctomycetota bacterium]